MYMSRGSLRRKGFTDVEVGRRSEQQRRVLDTEENHINR